jgi:hypothetical protein
MPGGIQPGKDLALSFPGGGRHGSFPHLKALQIRMTSLGIILEVSSLPNFFPLAPPLILV